MLVSPLDWDQPLIQSMDLTSDADSTELCDHAHVYTHESGRGYCCDCGMNITQESGTISTQSLNECPHKATYRTESGLHVCYRCNKELEIFSHEAEWRYYDNHVGGSFNDPSRCHSVRSEFKSLKKTFDTLKIDVPDAIRHQTEQDFSIIVGDKTLRSRNRNSIIAACLFHAYIKFGECRTNDYIRDMFDLSRRDMSKGIKEYQKVFPESRSVLVRPHDLVSWIFYLTDIDRRHYANVIKILDYITNTSAMINRSTAQSVANAAIYFYLRLNPEYQEKLGLTKSVFANLVNLSEITISKLVKEISSITQLPVKV